MPLDLIQPARASLQTALGSVEFDPPEMNGILIKTGRIERYCIGEALNGQERNQHIVTVNTDIAFVIRQRKVTKSRSPIVRPDGCILRTFGDIASNMGGYFFDIWRNKQVCRSKGCGINSLASSPCQLSPNISGIPRFNSLRSHNVEYVSGIWTHRIAGGRMEHGLPNESAPMLSQLIPSRTVENGQERMVFTSYERQLLSHGHTREPPTVLKVFERIPNGNASLFGRSTS